MLQHLTPHFVFVCFFLVVQGLKQQTWRKKPDTFTSLGCKQLTGNKWSWQANMIAKCRKLKVGHEGGGGGGGFTILLCVFESVENLNPENIPACNRHNNKSTNLRRQAFRLFLTTFSKWCCDYLGCGHQVCRKRKLLRFSHTVTTWMYCPTITNMTGENILVPHHHTVNLMQLTV